MNGQYFLSEILTPDRLLGNCINVIKCPTGAGKTTFALGELPKHINSDFEILYITDSNMNRSQILSNKDYNVKAYRKEWRNFVNNNKILIPQGWGSFRETYVTVMNYAQVGAILYYGHPFDWSKFQYVICDELHNLINYQNIKSKDGSINILKYTKRKIEETMCLYPNVKILCLSATPQKVYENFTNTYDVLTPQEYAELRCYETFNTEFYFDRIKVIDKIQQGKRGIVYSTHIKKLKELNEILITKGHKVSQIWSTANKEHEMTAEQLAVRQYIIDNQRIPNHVDILLINSACETGVNIKNNNIDFMIINSIDIDTVTQVRGRLRNDLDLLYIYSPTAENLPNDVPAEYLNRKLDADEKREMCVNKIRLLNKKGNPLMWRSVKPYLESEGYKITECFKKKERATIIETG